MVCIKACSFGLVISENKARKRLIERLKACLEPACLPDRCSVVYSQETCSQTVTARHCHRKLILKSSSYCRGLTRVTRCDSNPGAQSTRSINVFMPGSARVRFNVTPRSAFHVSTGPFGDTVCCVATKHGQSTAIWIWKCRYRYTHKVEYRLSRVISRILNPATFRVPKGRLAVNATRDADPDRLQIAAMCTRNNRQMA